MRLPLLLFSLFCCVAISAATQAVAQPPGGVDAVVDQSNSTTGQQDDDAEVVDQGVPEELATEDPAGEEGEQEATADSADMTWPVTLLVVGIVSVLGMIIGLKMNAFLALIISALIVSLGVGYVQDESAGARMGEVVQGFGGAAESIGIVIAMAAIIGKCMLDSGAADRIVRSAVQVTGEKKASLGLMFSGFVLAIPVFFDTVFYLLVPLARSLYHRTKRNYLRYLMAIATGGAITHTLVPPTPGPLLVSAILGVDIGVMMLVGTMVALPAAVAGLIYAVVADRVMPVEMRPLGASENRHEALSEDRLPSLFVSLLPVLIPVVLIGAGTLANTIADAEDKARLVTADIADYDRLSQILRDAEPVSPAGRVIDSSKLSEQDREFLRQPAETEQEKEQTVALLNEVLLDASLYREEAFLGTKLPDVAKGLLKADQLRMKPVDRRRLNRTLLEAAFPDLIAEHQWESPRRKWAQRLSLWGNANFALLLAALCAMLTLKYIRALSWRSLGHDVEESLMSGGVIILITAAGGAFGAMLQDTEISDAIKGYFSDAGAAGTKLLLLGWGIAAVLKIAQGSSTVAMIVGAGMMAAIIGDTKPNFNMVYVATAVGSGSLFGSWMNDSGFWVFTKMGVLTESESLRSWTPLLVVLSLVSLLITIVLSIVLPMQGGT